MPEASIAIQVLPKAKNGKQSLKIIDDVIGFIKKQDVTYEVGPMETVMEGDLDQLLEIVRKIQYLAVKKGAEFLFSYIKIIYEPRGVMTIREKVTKHRMK